ncbi:MAG: EF-hand domain-containing protein [Candidatus Heimdallarchaeota archaeon]|nr:EF-hand domain-containing protein [Candidatus Heimdallarchaeota archaeon]
MLEELQKKKIGMLFQAMDADKNGVIDENDFKRLGENFSSIQKSEMDFNAMFMDVHQTITTLADTNKDQKVSVDEFYTFWDKTLGSNEGYGKFVTGFAQSFFKILDSNNDSMITKDEYGTFLKAFGADNFDPTTTFEGLAEGSEYITSDRWMTVIEEFFTETELGKPGNLLFGPM